MNPRRLIGRLLNAPLKTVGLKLSRSATIDEYEARLNDLNQALAHHRYESARQVSGYRQRLEEAEAALPRQKEEAEARLQEALKAEAAKRVTFALDGDSPDRAVERLCRQLAPAAALPLPVYLTNDLCPATQLAQGTSPYRVVVCSIPKAGTYLVDRLLELLGCVPSRLHLSRWCLTDYRFATVREARVNYERLIRDVPLERAIELHLPGQFSVGHLGCTEDTRQVLSNVKKLFVYRDLRDGLVSYLRFLASTGRGGDATRAWKDLPAGPEKTLRFLDAAGQGYFDMALPMIDWLDQPDVFFIEFETLYGDHGEEEQKSLIERLHSFLELPGGAPDVDRLRPSLIGSPTMTWSGGRVARETYWNDEVEERFVAFGGLAANRRLGYDLDDAARLLRLPSGGTAHRRAA